MTKPEFCLCQNKGTDQHHSHCEADQRLCFRYMDTTIPLLPKSESSSIYPSSVDAQRRLCRTWSETPETGFLCRGSYHSQQSMSYLTIWLEYLLFLCIEIKMQIKALFLSPFRNIVFHYLDSIMTILLQSKILIFQPFFLKLYRPVCVTSGWTLKTNFLV